MITSDSIIFGWYIIAGSYQLLACTIELCISKPNQLPLVYYELLSMLYTLVLTCDAL